MDTKHRWITKVCKKLTELFATIDEVITMSNATSVGVHERVMTFVSDTDIAQAGLLVYRTAQPQARACSLAHGNTWPVGVAQGAAAKGEELSVALLGSACSTLRMVTATPITAGEPVYSAQAGCVQGTPTAAGTYYRVGLALTSAQGAHQWIEVDPSAASPLIVHATDCAQTL